MEHPLPLEETAPELAAMLIDWSQNHPPRKVMKRAVTIDQVVSGMELAKKSSYDLSNKDKFWLFVRAALNKDPRMLEAKVGRNEPCTCGSGKKFKKCHG